MTLIEELEHIKRDIKGKKKNALDVETIVKVIIDAWNEHEHVSILIRGKRGTGKTTLALTLLRGVYGSWEIALQRLWFNPFEALKEVVELIEQYEEIKDMIIESEGSYPIELLPVAIALDDAGVPLSKYFTTKYKEAFFKVANMFREMVGSAIYTDTVLLHKFVRDTADIIIHLKKATKHDMEKFGLNPRFKWSIGKVYEVKDNVLANYLKKHSVIVFPLYLPDHVRAMYRRKRLEFVKSIVENIDPNEFLGL